MYKVLLVDDEYMITEGLKRLIPFDKWDMEVVATANHADSIFRAHEIFHQADWQSFQASVQVQPYRLV